MMVGPLNLDPRGPRTGKGEDTGPAFLQRAYCAPRRLLDHRGALNKGFMADTKDPAAKAVKTLSSADIERASEFARETILLEGETPEALAPGTARRRAVDAALEEIAEGNESPSIEWRQDFSLMLGLERLLDDDEPKLADGATLDPHQVDALSGTLAALVTELERSGANGRSNGASAAHADDDDPAESAR